jgi:hypothetical protein
VWAADTNYRIDEENEQVRQWAQMGEFSPLLAADQLRSAISDHDAFIGYREGDITFRPTYKYDRGTNDYDTSEKMRIPAWTGVCTRAQTTRIKR